MSVVCFDEVQRLFTCAGALLRQGLPLAVHHPNRDGGFGLRYTAFGFALEGRDVTRNEQRFLIPIPFSMFPECQKAEIDDCVQEITKVIDLSPRYTAIQVRIYKG